MVFDYGCGCCNGSLASWPGRVSVPAKRVKLAAAWQLTAASCGRSAGPSLLRVAAHSEAMLHGGVLLKCAVHLPTFYLVVTLGGMCITLYQQLVCYVIVRLIIRAHRGMATVTQSSCAACMCHRIHGHVTACDMKHGLCCKKQQLLCVVMHGGCSRLHRLSRHMHL
ncbi:hypothetical protein COO60DRAFT_378185 [Scenedesmus sp. NREL 46B-D3]|nr:hypothetical protein COO60DRAFT_378185 [Scenedesmus sp. NREL 46B-D3]